MADYITVTDLASLGHEPDAISGNAGAMLVTAASRLFDKLAGVSDDFFAVAANPAAYTARTFYGNGTGYLPIDPYTALNPVNPVTIDADYAYDVPDYVVRDGMLVFYGTYTQRRAETWYDGIAVTVSANWGFPAVPQDVKLACIALALNMFRTSDAAFARISEVDPNATIPPLARDIINGYRGRYGTAGVFA